MFRLKQKLIKFNKSAFYSPDARCVFPKQGITFNQKVKKGSVGIILNEFENPKTGGFIEAFCDGKKLFLFEWHKYAKVIL